MNPGFHCTHPCLIVDGNEGWKYSWHSNLEARFALFIQLTPRGTHRKLFRVSATDVLQKVPLFSQLSPPDLQRVVEVARDRAYPKNSVILFEDDPGDALYVVADPLFFTNRTKIIARAMDLRLPTMCNFREYAEAGCSMSYGPNYLDLFRRAATYVDKILRGAKPADLPVEQPTKFELVINLKTAKALGLTIPQSVLVRADEIIE